MRECRRQGRLTPPSRGQPQAGCAHLRLPLTSNVSRHKMLSRLFRRRPSLLDFLVDGKHLATFLSDELPSEKSPSVRVALNSKVECVVPGLPPVVHYLSHEQGWAHFSVRVSAGFACQIDCVVGQSPNFDPTAITQGRATGVRFQPFLLPGARDSNAIFAGRGLFNRGLHYAGTVTPGSVSLSCICDACAKNFRLQSFHAGFSGVGYFYSASGRYTLVVSEHVPGAPPALGKPEPEALAKLQSLLPAAPDGTSFEYFNSLRCPHCGSAYIDFTKHPEQRESEYYGNTFFGEQPSRSGCSRFPTPSRSLQGRSSNDSAPLG